MIIGPARTVIAILVLTAAPTPQVAAAQPHEAPNDTPPLVVVNDNRTAAGSGGAGTWHLALRAARGRWHPEGQNGRVLEVAAFGEESGPMSVPAPLIRVAEGTEITASIRNDLDAPLRVHGLCSRNGAACPPIEIPPGAARETRFVAATPGTYHYWATTTGMPLFLRGSSDSQLSGAFVVDAAGGPEFPDRVLVITEWTSLTTAQLGAIAAAPDPGASFLKLRPDVLFTINGRSWPHTERFTYDLGETIRWRIVNLSTQTHPMHLHGFYFDVTAQGDGTRDEALPPERRLRVVTHLLGPGSTMGMGWTPERSGQWLFHCHTMVHVSPTLHVDGSPRSNSGQAHAHHGDDPGLGMSGLVLGIVVRGKDDAGTEAGGAPGARQLTLVMQSEPRRFGDAPALGFRLADGRDARPTGPVPVPGPTLVLRRGEPVEITLVNQMEEATSIHWHGMELPSYYDGVHGWSGNAGRLAPSIDPGGTFVVRFTPPRAGTFIYHTHLHDNRQLTSGLYGAMLVLEPGDTFDESVDHVFVIGRGGPAMDAPIVINGEETPQMIWTSGVRHRVRLINITPNDTVSVALRTGAEVVAWRPIAKDGATVLPDRSNVTSAVQIIGVGETYDFEYDAPARRQSLWLEVKSPGGQWLAQGRVIVTSHHTAREGATQPARAHP